MASHVTLPFDGNFDALRAKLLAWRFEVGERPNAPLFAKGPGVTLHAYRTGKMLLSGARAQEWADKIAPGAAPLAPPRDPLGLPASVTSGVRAGIDEAGKGDYFGPLVIAGVVVDDERAQRLKDAGVRDSKTLGDADILAIAERMRSEILPETAWTLVTIEPERYNALHAKTRNLNMILGWGHARAIENLLQGEPRCKAALSDQFGDPRYIQDALMARGKGIELVQTPRAEREIAVAAASILARAEFVLQMRMMSARHDFRFPLGATHVETPARAFVQRFGEPALGKVAKLHFVTTQRVLRGRGGPSR